MRSSEHVRPVSFARVVADSWARAGGDVRAFAGARVVRGFSRSAGLGGGRFAAVALSWSDHAELAGGGAPAGVAGVVALRARKTPAGERAHRDAGGGRGVRPAHGADLD